MFVAIFQERKMINLNSSEKLFKNPFIYTYLYWTNPNRAAVMAQKLFPVQIRISPERNMIDEKFQLSWKAL